MAPMVSPLITCWSTRSMDRSWRGAGERVRPDSLAGRRSGCDELELAVLRQVQAEEELGQRAIGVPVERAGDTLDGRLLLQALEPLGRRVVVDLADGGVGASDDVHGVIGVGRDVAGVLPELLLELLDELPGGRELRGLRLGDTVDAFGGGARDLQILRIQTAVNAEHRDVHLLVSDLARQQARLGI